MTVLFVALGAAICAPARYLGDFAISRRWPHAFPLGTFTVNLIASFVLGITVGLGSRLTPELQAFVATGLCGTLSTFSTFSYEVMTLSRKGRRITAAAYVVVSVIAGMGVGALGWVIGA